MELELMHGKDWSGENVAGWFASEKFDGHRIRWTGAELFTRAGNKVDAPAWFVSHLPAMPLDCELWAGRGKTHNDVKRLRNAEAWDSLKLVAFDVPETSVEQAIEILAAIPNSATFRRVESTEAAKRMMRDVVASGGEGVMARRPGSKYQSLVRSDDLLKIKPSI
jgi:DNA ligase-1